MRLAMEKDLETVRQAALLLEAENRKLVAKNLELQTELLKLKGLGVEQLALRLAELEQQLAARNKMLFGSSSEKRNKRSKDGQPERPQKGHGPTEQPHLRLTEQLVQLGDVNDLPPALQGQRPSSTSLGSSHSVLLADSRGTGDTATPRDIRTKHLTRPRARGRYSRAQRSRSAQPRFRSRSAARNPSRSS
jgi:hypothetical protein